jgi:predicted HTH domain antitoxin
MTTVAIDLPDEAFSALKRPPREFAQSMRLAAAIYWYAQGKVSMEKAALIAGLDRADFLAALAAEKVDVFEVDMESLKRELERG